MGYNGLKKSWIFPGQASQFVGMGKDLFDSTDVGKKYYNLANDILEVDIQDISFNGPEEKLKITKYTQPAIFIVSSVISHLLIENGHVPGCVAGHSLGEYSALTAAGGISFETGLELVKIRSNSMDKAGITNPGTMAAIIGLNMDSVVKLANSIKTNEVVVAANHNTENQIVISGNINAVNEFVSIAKENGARMAIPLNVSGAFHSSLMQPAREELADKLNSIQISDIIIPLYSNVNAKPTMKGSEIKKSLISQLESPVLWFETINNMVSNGNLNFLEVGPGKVLSGLNKKINRDLTTTNIGTFEELNSYEV